MYIYIYIEREIYYCYYHCCHYNHQMTQIHAARIPLGREVRQLPFVRGNLTPRKQESPRVKLQALQLATSRIGRGSIQIGLRRVGFERGGWA